MLSREQFEFSSLSGDQWLFVMGSPRSGTSLLRRVLSHHRSLYVSPELRILELVKIASILVARNGELVVNADIDPTSMAIGLSFGRFVRKQQLQSYGKTHYGDKYPPYCHSVVELNALYPKARFIHIIRDGRDVVASLARTRVANRGWRRSSSVPPMSQLVSDWVSFVTNARTVGKSLGPDRYLELKYEDLLRQPEATLRPVFAFLGESVESDISGGLGEIRSGKSWRETLSQADLSAFRENIEAEELLKSLGYPATPGEPSESEDERQSQAHKRADLGEDSPSVWEALADEALAIGDERMAIDRLVRAIRGSDTAQGACLKLLGMPHAPESVFAAMNAVTFSGVDSQFALASWTRARGLDDRASQALFSILEPA